MSARPSLPPSARPSVTVIIPFAGPATELGRLAQELGRLALGAGDELLVADNRPGASADWREGPVRVLAAPGLRAPGFARNRAARVARGEWLVFVDADASPSPVLLERYFNPAPSPRTGLLAGGIVDRAGSDRRAARLTAARGQMSQRVTLCRNGSPYAQTANCAVRRCAFEAVGGFDERARCGEDADLCFRLAQAGWGYEERPGAVVEHPTRATLGALLIQLARHGSGAAWLNRRYPDEFPPPRARELAGRLARGAYAVGAASVRRDREAGAAALIALASSCAFDLGRLLPNRPPSA